MRRLGLFVSRLIPSSSASGLSRRSYTQAGTKTLLKERRIVFINDPISVSRVVSELLFLESENPKKPVHLYIYSDSGDITSGLAIYDTIQRIRSPVTTLCMGWVGSMGSLLLAAGAPGERRSFPNSLIRVHQPSASGINGLAVDMVIHAKEREMLKAIYNKHTGQPLENIEKLLDRNTFLFPEEAKELGIVDEVIEHRPIALVTDAGSGSSSSSGV